MPKKKSETETVDPGSGDVLVDLGFPDADERKLRVQLAMRLNELVADRHLTQARAASVQLIFLISKLPCWRIVVASGG